jgi:hypothetical protein
VNQEGLKLDDTQQLEVKLIKLSTCLCLEIRIQGKNRNTEVSNKYFKNV